MFRYHDIWYVFAASIWLFIAFDNNGMTEVGYSIIILLITISNIL